MFKVLIYSHSDLFHHHIADAVTLEMKNLTEPVPFAVEPYADCSDDNAFAAHIATLARTVDGLIVISDRFAPDAKPATAGGGLAELLRVSSSDGSAITALLAVVDTLVPQIVFVDCIVESGADQQTFAEAFRRVLRAVRYKLPPAPQRAPLADTAVEVRPVASVNDFRACLALRHQAYSLLGYFRETPQHDSGGLELDYYDQSALHFVAVASGPPPRRVAGTARLVLAKTSMGRASLFGNAPDIRSRSTGLSDRVAADWPALRDKLERGPGPVSLPLFASFGYGEISGAPASTEVGDFCEISRVVVSEDCRGLGISRLLVRACVAAAIDLQHRFVLLECIPQHVPLYEKLGFARIRDVNHQRAWGVDQLAVVMRLDLADTPDNIAVQLAKKDSEMLAVPRQANSRSGLCRCRNSQCWERGAYDYRAHRCCPLRTSFLP